MDCRRAARLNGDEANPPRQNGVRFVGRIQASEHEEQVPLAVVDRQTPNARRVCSAVAPYWTASG